MKYNFLDWGLIREGGFFESGGLIDHLRYVVFPGGRGELIVREVDETVVGEQPNEKVCRGNLTYYFHIIFAVTIKGL